MYFQIHFSDSLDAISLSSNHINFSQQAESVCFEKLKCKEYTILASKIPTTAAPSHTWLFKFKLIKIKEIKSLVCQLPSYMSMLVAKYD